MGALLLWRLLVTSPFNKGKRTTIFEVNAEDLVESLRVAVSGNTRRRQQNQRTYSGQKGSRRNIKSFVDLDFPCPRSAAQRERKR